MLRSYKRAVEQAETEGRSLEQIAAERWGSLEKLHSLLRAAGIDPDNPDHPPKTGRREYLYSAILVRLKMKNQQRYLPQNACWKASYLLLQV